MVKIVAQREILPRDFLQAVGKCYLSLIIAKMTGIKNSPLKKFGQCLKALIMRLSV